MSDKELQDPRFKKYVQLIERNLQSFDAVNEWADIISFLGRLLKSFQAYPQFKTIPHKQIVSKRLAQCLNPGFPAGVHQKTLEVYAYILETIGKQQLADDLPLWSVGLFPFIQYAATHVKPQLLALFEKYYYPLGAKLRPAMRGFIIALLPALDEEGSEGFDKVVTMLDRLSDMVELPYFYSCMWLVMINDTNLRLFSLNYLLRRLPKITNTEDVALVLGGPDNIGLMVRAFSATLMDQQLLVQRGMLELLVQNFVLQYRTLSHDDLVLLTRSAVSIVLRKDMSLNRRLYAWLLGSDTATQAQLRYFHCYAEKAATQAIRGLFFATPYQAYRNIQDDVDMSEHANGISSFTTDAQRPYKILISLLDKWEIGQPIVNNVFTDSLTSLQRYAEHGAIEHEILQTANMWMEMIEPYLIWRKLFGIMDASFPPSLVKSSASTLDYSRKKRLSLVEFTLQSFRFTDEEFKQMHLPLVLAAMGQKLQESIRDPAFTDTLTYTIQFIDIILMVLSQLPDSVFVDRHRKPSTASELATGATTMDYEREFNSDTDALGYARDFYYGVKRRDEDHSNTATTLIGSSSSDMNDQGDEGDLTSQRTSVTKDDETIAAITKPAYGPLRGSILMKQVTSHLIRFLAELVDNYVVAPDNRNTVGVDVGVDGKRLRYLDAQLEQVLHGVCVVLTTLMKHADHGSDDPVSQDLMHTLLKCCQQSSEFGVVDAGLSTLAQLIRQQWFSGELILKNKSEVKRILDKLWVFLGPSTQLLHMRTVELLWLLTDSSTRNHVEVIVAGYLIVADDCERMMNYEKFGIFWELSENMVDASTVFSRPMFLMLDLLRDDSSPINRRAAETWVRCHLKSYARLLEPFVITLLDRHIIRRPAEKHIPYVYQTIYRSHQPQQQDQLDQSHKVSYFLYMRQFDTDVVDYMLTTLTTLIQFGGVGVLKACSNYMVGATGPMPSLIEYSLGILAKDHPKLNFLELLVHIAIRFLESEPSEKLYTKIMKPVRQIQLHASDLLYLIVSKLDYVDITITALIQQSVLQKLLFCIASGDLDIQPKLLHLLHATMAITAAATNLAGHKPDVLSTSSSTSTASTKRHQHLRHRSSTTSLNIDHLSSSPLTNTSNVSTAAATATTATTSPSQLLLQRPPNALLQFHIQQDALKLARSTANIYVKCVMDAFHTPNNRPILSQWMDFVLVTLPHVRQGFRQVIVPILICFCEQINLCNVTVRLLMHGATDDKANNLQLKDDRFSMTKDGLNWKHLNDDDGEDNGSLDTSTLTRHHQDHGGSKFGITQPLIQERGAIIGGPETDILVFLNGLEKLLSYGISDRSLNDLWSSSVAASSTTALNNDGLMMPRVEDHSELWGLIQVMMQYPAAVNMPTTGTSGLSVDNNFIDTQTSNGDRAKPRNALLFHLPVILHILLDVWRVFRRPAWNQHTVDVIGFAKKDAVLQSFAYAADHVKARLEATFEMIYKNCPADVIEGFAEIFFTENPIALEYEVSPDHFDMMAIELLTCVPTSSPQQIMTILLDSIRQRTPGIPQSHRKRSILRSGKLTDTSLLRFTELYCQEMIKPANLSTLWPLVYSFAKEYLSQASAYKSFLPGLLRFLTVMLDGFMRFSEDRKMRKDAQDLYQRCADYCIMISGRSFDQSLWLRGRNNVYEDDHQQQDTYLSSTSSASIMSNINTASSSVTNLALTQSAVGTELFFDNSTLVNGSSAGSGDVGGPSLPRNLSTSAISDLEKKASWKSREDFMIIQINHYLATDVIPQLRQLIGDQDRVNSLLNNLVYYVIGPHLRSRSSMPSMPTMYKKRGLQSSSPSSGSSSPLINNSTNNNNNNKVVMNGGLLHGGAVIVDQIVEMAKMPFTYKTWRKEVWDAFNEGRFFYMTRTTALKWCKILSTMFSLEKDRFVELMSKIVTSPIVNNSAFFTTSNKDQENWQRALHLRRVSFVIFAGTTDQFVPQLPLLQEKMVELLKLDHSEMVHVEIYLCLRILLVRFSQKHLINFWPVLISELMRLFNAVLSNVNHDRPEEAQIALGGCKFLDLLCTLELDSFQVYQWIFIRDTVEAVIQREQAKATESVTLSMMEKLCDKMHNPPSSSSSSLLSSSSSSAFSSEVGTNNNASTVMMEQEGGTDWTRPQHDHNNNNNGNNNGNGSMTLPSTGELKRPMLTMHNIGSISQLDFFIRHISLYVYQSSYMLAKPDMFFVENLLLQDLLDGDMRTE